MIAFSLFWLGCVPSEPKHQDRPHLETGDSDTTSDSVSDDSSDTDSAPESDTDSADSGDTGDTEDTSVPGPTTWTVCGHGPADFATIDDAHGYPIPGDTISVCPGTYEQIRYTDEGVTIESTDGSAATFLTGSDHDPTGTGVLACITVWESDVTVRGFTCIGFEHTAWDGSEYATGAETYGDNVTIQDFVLDPGPASIDFWVGISAVGTVGTVIEDFEIRNYVGDYAGPIDLEAALDFSITRGRIDAGSMVSVGLSTGSIRDLFFVNGSLTWTCDTSEPSPDLAGFLDVASGSTVDVSNVTLSDDQGVRTGCTAAISCHDSTLTLHNSIIANNTGYGIYTSGCTVDAAYNLSYGNSEGDFDIEGITTPGPTDLNVDPMFTDPTSSDYTLTPGSPAIDAGDPDPAYNDVDGTRNDLGYTGGPEGM